MGRGSDDDDDDDRVFGNARAPNTAAGRRRVVEEKARARDGRHAIMTVRVRPIPFGGVVVADGTSRKTRPALVGETDGLILNQYSRGRWGRPIGRDLRHQQPLLARAPPTATDDKRV